MCIVVCMKLFVKPFGALPARELVTADIPHVEILLEL